MKMTRGSEMAHDFNALQRWNTVPKEFRQKILDNVFCSNCHTTTIVDYEIKDNKYGVLIEGKCKKCGKDVARVVEDI
jgi:hypothetical protein